MKVFHGTERNPIGETTEMWGNRPPILHIHIFYTHYSHIAHKCCTHILYTHYTCTATSQHTHCTHVAHKHYMYALQYTLLTHHTHIVHTHWPRQFLYVESDKFTQSSARAFVPAKYHYYSVSEIPEPMKNDIELTPCIYGEI